MSKVEASQFGGDYDEDYARALIEVVEESGDADLSYEEMMALITTDPSAGEKVLAFLMSRHVSKRELAVTPEEQQAA